MKISLFEFVRTGIFGNIKLNDTKDEILSKFSPPDYISDMGHEMWIWSYSTFEFHFYKEQLTLLWCDNLYYLENPEKKQFEFDFWILKHETKITFSYFCSLLHQNNIAYHECSKTGFETDKLDLPDNIIINIENTDAVIYFEDCEEQAKSIDEYTLVAIGSTALKSTYKNL